VLKINRFFQSVVFLIIFREVSKQFYLIRLLKE